ncbi:hypothetical protein Nepgr_010201 [Nepenthes gracilis]|uniref:Uncharacterized protein n=1 Tax=Nepenthes gracilis TaxID=150966 RepID=A0AAD3SCQ7_NEPGR|nr:hypothetical protein Nepgr_010201 [Nepenthes gracilis]
MAAKILANLIVMGSGILIRAFAQAYRQALANASRTGVAQETIQNTVHRASRAMSEQEARQILGIPENSTWEEILKKYEVLFERNGTQGSFYLQSKFRKLHRIKFFNQFYAHLVVLEYKVHFCIFYTTDSVAGTI